MSDEPDVGAQIGAAATGPTKPDLTPEGVAQRANAGNAGSGCLLMLGVTAIFLVISLVWSAVAGDDDDGGSDDRGSSAGAFGVCTQFVEDRLRAPGTASFPNQFQDDGEVTITGGPDVFTVSSHVDAENGFGGEVRTPFVCKVRHVEGENWRLVDLSLG